MFHGLGALTLPGVILASVKYPSVYVLFQRVQSSEASQHLPLFLFYSDFALGIWVLFVEHLPLWLQDRQCYTEA